MKKKNKLQWNVFVHNINSDEIEIYNIFEHLGFNKDIKKANKNISDDEKFFKQVLDDLVYYFWAKCEYETLVSGLFSKDNELKIDAYTQVKMNLSAFKEYLLSHREDI